MNILARMDSQTMSWPIRASLFTVGSLWLYRCLSTSKAIEDENAIQALKKTSSIWKEEAELHAFTSEPDEETLSNPIIHHAEQAIEYTIKALPLGAVNKKGASGWACFLFTAMTIQLYLERDFLSQVEFYRQMGNLAKFYGVGNCGEHAAVAFQYLEKNHPNLQIELVGDFANDHAFVVIDRNPKSNIEDSGTWGNRAIVCDAWAQRWFLAKDLDAQLEKILTTLPHPPLVQGSLQKKRLKSLDYSGTFNDSCDTPS